MPANHIVSFLPDGVHRVFTLDTDELISIARSRLTRASPLTSVRPTALIRVPPLRTVNRPKTLFRGSKLAAQNDTGGSTLDAASTLSIRH